jgi:hypothetical protein
MSFQSILSSLLIIGASLILGTPVHGQETVEKQSKIVVLFDVSASMGTIDGPAVLGKDPATLPRRLDQVMQFLTSKGKSADAPFMEQLLKKASVTAYRFGSTLDDLDVVQFADGKTWTVEQWTRWIKGESKITNLRASTNVAGSALQMLHKERDSYLQAIIIFSDGRSNRSTADEIDALLDRVQDRSRPIPVITIGVGELKALPSIRIEGLDVPQAIRSDGELVVRVPIVGHGLDGETFQVLLEAQRVSDSVGKPLAREKVFLPGPQTGTFKNGKAQLVEFKIDLKKLRPNASNRDGTWEFTARVPSHSSEAFTGTEHVSEPVQVVVRDRAQRVLLFASAPTREFQFLRTMLDREMMEKRMEVAIYMQTGEKEFGKNVARILKEFPSTFDGKDPDSLSEFDVVVAFDPDWSKLSTKQLGALNKFVGEHGGGVVFVAGPVFSHQVPRPAGHEGIIKQLSPIYPVVLKDARLHGLGGTLGHDTSRPFALNFTPYAKDFPFLKLDESGDSPTAGWNAFFWNDEKKEIGVGDASTPKRGFYTYYPVEGIKPASVTIAAVASPRESRIGDKTDAFKDQQPFLVTMPYGAGRTLYLGSGELWRLRAFKESYYEPLWLAMIRYVAVGATSEARRPRNSSRVQLPRPNGELDDVRVDFGDLYHLASKAEPLLSKMPADARGAIAAALRQSAQFSEATRTDEAQWLFFRLAFADAVPMCLEKLPPKRFPKVETPKDDPPGEGSFKSVYQEKKTLKILVIDGEGAKGRQEKGDSYFLGRAIASIPRSAYAAVFGDELAGSADARKSLERDGLDTFGAIVLVNVSNLSKQQLANLEKYSQQGGGVAFFLGPKVNVNEYNESLYKAGKGIFPAPLVDAPTVEAHRMSVGETEQLLLRDDLFPDLVRYPIFGELFSERRMREYLRFPSIHRHFKVARSAWKPVPGRAFELATLPNLEASSKFQKEVQTILCSPELKQLLEEPAFEQYQKTLDQNRARIERVVKPGTGLKANHLVEALDNLLLDRRDNLTEFWRNPDFRIRAILEDVVRLRHQARYGDPLIVGGSFGKGRVVAVLTTAGTQWNDLAAGGVASMLYPGLIWEMTNYLTRQDRSDRAARPAVDPQPGYERPPQMIGVDVNFEPRKLTGKDDPNELADAYLVTPDAFLAFHGKLADDFGLRKAHWIVQVHPVEFAKRKFVKILPPQPEEQLPMPQFFAEQEKRAYDKLTRNVLTGAKDKRWPIGFARTYDLVDEFSFDFQKHLARLKPKGDAPQGFFLVKLWISAAGSGPNSLSARSEPFVFLVVSPLELRGQVNREAELFLEKLDVAKEKADAALSSLDEQITRLKDANADLEVAAVRLAEIRTAVQTAASSTRGVHAAYTRFTLELKRNRVGNDAVASMEATTELLAHLTDHDLVFAEDALHRLMTTLESRKRDKILGQAVVAQQSLKDLDKGFKRSLEKMAEAIVEAKLIQILRQMDERQRDITREIDRSIDRMLEDLLKTLDKKK